MVIHTSLINTEVINICLCVKPAKRCEVIQALGVFFLYFVAYKAC